MPGRSWAADPHAGTRVTADEALRILLKGNGDFVAGNLTHKGRSPADFRPLAEGQTPIAAVLGCSDSRVPPEILFDAAIGQLFVTRVAGNYVSGAGAAVKGSMEYAVAELGVPLVVVLGHTNCGAVKAAIESIEEKEPLPGAIEDLVKNIRPAVAKSSGTGKELLEAAIRNNVLLGVERLRTLDPIISPKVKAGHVNVVGMTYGLDTGRVSVVS